MIHKHTTKCHVYHTVCMTWWFQRVIWLLHLKGVWIIFSTQRGDCVLLTGLRNKWQGAYQCTVTSEHAWATFSVLVTCYWWQIWDCIRQASYMDADVTKSCRSAGIFSHSKRRGENFVGKALGRLPCVTERVLYSGPVICHPVQPGSVASCTVILVVCSVPNPEECTGLSQITF